jgi:large subunit ribosomal protein LP2
MRYVAAYLLAALNPDNKDINAKLITDILAAGGIEADQEKVTSLLKEMEGKSVTDVLSAGRSKLSVVSTAAASSSTAASTATTSTTTVATDNKKEAPKKEKTPEVSEEDADGLLDFF